MIFTTLSTICFHRKAFVLSHITFLLPLGDEGIIEIVSTPIAGTEKKGTATITGLAKRRA
jgi:hypothetical protein